MGLASKTNRSATLTEQLQPVSLVIRLRLTWFGDEEHNDNTGSIDIHAAVDVSGIRRTKHLRKTRYLTMELLNK